MKLETFNKQPSEFKDYDVDFAPWLTDGDTLDTVTTRVECLSDATDQTLSVDTPQFTATRAKFWVRGGTSGRKYKVTIAVTTVVGRVDESELIFVVKEI